MQVTVNGTPRHCPTPLTVDDLVADLAGRRRGVAVAVNGEVVPRAGWQTTELADGDLVEVLTAAQGG